jgi:hypothetical protein
MPNRGPAGRRHQKCKTCVATYGREHYARNREAYISRNVTNMRGRRRSLKERVWDYVANQACVDCGERDPLVLDFDHVDPENKRREIYWLALALLHGCRFSMRLPNARSDVPAAIACEPRVSSPGRYRLLQSKKHRSGALCCGLWRCNPRAQLSPPTFRQVGCGANDVAR